MSKKKKIWIAVIAVLLIGSALNMIAGIVNPKKEPAEEVSATGITTAPTQEVTPEPTEKPVNPLMAAKLKTADIKNGSNTEVIGTRAYINLSKKKLKNITEDEFFEFMEDVIQKNEYNWVTIFCGDGTGLRITRDGLPTYGEVDEEGMTTKAFGYARMTDGKYIYEKAE